MICKDIVKDLLFPVYAPSSILPSIGCHLFSRIPVKKSTFMRVLPLLYAGFAGEENLILCSITALQVFSSL